MSSYGKVVTTVKCGKSKTQQHFADQVNINNIIARNRKTGMLTHVNARQPFYGDVSDMRSYEDALMTVSKANDLFSSMSSTVRERFGNDPSLMVKFLADPKNMDEAIELGMVIKRPAADAKLADVVTAVKSLKDASGEPKGSKSKVSSKSDE